MTDAPARVFIGSSSEGLDVARNLEAELGAMGACEVDRWDRDVFEPSGYTLDSLISTSKIVDFAVLIASPDDIVVSRGKETPSVRDNILLEFGLFAGALGRERTYLLATGDDSLKLPTDTLGLTRLRYKPRSDDNVRAAVNDAALQIQEQVRRRGRRAVGSAASTPGSHQAVLEQELDLLCANARAQGWTVKTNSLTTLRLRTHKGKAYTFPKGAPEATRADLRRFASELRAAGLRVNSSLRRAVQDSPL